MVWQKERLHIQDAEPMVCFLIPVGTAAGYKHASKFTFGFWAGGYVGASGKKRPKG